MLPDENVESRLFLLFTVQEIILFSCIARIGDYYSWPDFIKTTGGFTPTLILLPSISYNRHRLLPGIPEESIELTIWRRHS